MHHIALQTITWGDPQHDRFDSIFAHAAACGFDGLEIGFRRLRQVDPVAMAELLERHGLALSASHVGGNLEDPEQARSEGLDVGQAVTYLKRLGVTRLMQSGLNGLSGTALDQAIGNLNDAAKHCADEGVQLLYHNHDWEFTGDERIFDRLLDRACPELGFGPDLGWADRAGVDLGHLLDTLGDRLGVLHFKDFAANADATTAEQTHQTVWLGTGIVDFAPAWSWLAGHPDWDGWLTAEQDRATDADEAARRNAAWLQQELGKLDTAGAR